MSSSDPESTDRVSESARSRSGIEAGLEAIRGDVNAQLRRIGSAVREIDVKTLPRFAPDLPEELPPERIVELEREISALEPWLQGPFVIAGNLTIPGRWSVDGRWAWLEQNIPDLSGLRVLDVGTNAGYDAFMFKLRGAAEVLACEPHEFIHQARFLESIYHSGVDFQQIGWRELDPAIHGRFDFVHCHGVLHHEPHPIALLQKLRLMLSDDGELWFGSIMHAAAEQSEYIRFVPDSYAGDRTWWFVPGRLAMRWMLEVVGFDVTERSLSEGVRGEFPTLTGYFQCRPATPDAALGVPEYQSPPVRFALGSPYSPIYDARELASRRAQIWPQTPRPMPDIDWRDDDQLALCERVFSAQEPMRLRREKGADPTEYWADNEHYPALDAWVLAAMLRHSRPRRVIEVGSGFSSLITARVNRDELGGAMHVTCIEPDPREFLLAGVPGISDLRVETIQETPLELFGELAAGDVLFIDTSHTVKTGGDVTWIFHEIVPRLAVGVLVHVHDAFMPGDYPEPWVMQGWGWNEVYLVRSFLSFNSSFEVVWGTKYMLDNHNEAVRRAFPGQADHLDRGGAALWIRRSQ